MTVQSCSCISNDFELADRKFSYSARYRIVTNDRSQSAYEVLSEATSASPDPFPDYFDTYTLYGQTDNAAFMQRASCKPLNDVDGNVWIAQANWYPLSGTESNDQHTSRSNPLARPVIYSLEWEEITLPVEEGWNEEELSGISRPKDTFGPIQNAAGQEPSTPILKTKRIPVVVAEKNYASLLAIHYVEQNYGDSLNKTPFLGYAEGECLFRGITASKAKYEGGQQYYTGTIRIACQKGGWSYAMVNRGFKYLENGVLTEASVEDDTGNFVPVAEPINLELDGSRTADGQIGTVIHYRHRPKVNFSGLGI